MKYKILVADEDKYAHIFIRNTIESEYLNFEIISAYNGEDVFNIAYKKNVNLIIMSWDLPVLSGKQTLKKLRNDIKTSEIPVVVVTTKDKLREAFDAGANDLLVSPINTVSLLMRVKSMLSMFKLIKGLTQQTIELGQKSEELIKKNETLTEEKQKSDALLTNILPDEIATQLKNKGYVDPKTYRKVSVLFTDFEGFTHISEQLTPKEIIKELGIFFAEFDQIAISHYIEKIKTIGDAYMCVGGLPLRNKSNPFDTVLAGLEMQHFANELNKRKRANNELEWRLRVGIHTGRVIAGVVGTTKFAYDIWGDTVNTAARMESSGEAGKINISGETYNHIKDYFECEYRGKIKAKNKGEIDMYFVHGLQDKYSKDSNNVIPNNEFLLALSQY